MLEVTSKPDIHIIKGVAITTSLSIAACFDKRHADVMRSIQSLECSAEFRQRNFASANYMDEQGKPRPIYSITRDGFAFLAMGFTGKRAAQFKEAYINAFNEMEQQLQTVTPDTLHGFCEHIGPLPSPTGALMGEVYRAYLGYARSVGDAQPLTLAKFGLTLPGVLAGRGTTLEKRRTRTGIRSNVALSPAAVEWSLTLPPPSKGELKLGRLFVYLCDFELFGSIIEHMRESMSMDDEKIREVIKKLNSVIN
ncbi:Rha family transcriptional regulator [Escherichia coli]|nr:Rha family transcriptional regulator [Escherichia coli]